METYRISSKLKEREREYLIETGNDAALGAVCTTVFVDGVRSETVRSPHPEEIQPQEILSFVKVTHAEKKKEVESLLEASTKVASRGLPDESYQLGLAFYYKRLFHEAVDLFKAVLSVNPDHHQAFNHLGMASVAIGRISDAVVAATEAVSRRPGFADYRNNLGEVYLVDNNANRAIAEFQQAIEINMYYSEAYFNLILAKLQMAINYPNQAETPPLDAQLSELLTKSVLISPEYKTFPVLEEGVTALKKHDYVQALLAFKTVRDLKREARRQEFSSFYMRYFLQPEWITKETISERIQFLRCEIEKNPSYVDLRADLAACLLEQARLYWEEGTRAFAHAREMNPSLPHLQAAIDEAKTVCKNMDMAIQRIGEKEQVS